MGQAAGAFATWRRESPRTEPERAGNGTGMGIGVGLGLGLLGQFERSTYLCRTWLGAEGGAWKEEDTVPTRKCKSSQSVNDAKKVKKGLGRMAVGMVA